MTTPQIKRLCEELATLKGEEVLEVVDFIIEEMQRRKTKREAIKQIPATA